MSVYSGFATRQQETFYNKLLDRSIQLISVRLLHALKRIDELCQPVKMTESTAFGEQNNSEQKHDPKRLMMEGEAERKWIHQLRKIFNALHNMDKHKYLEPKFSQSLYPVMKFLQKRNGPGSNLSVISKMSQSQRGGGPLQFGSVPFNDSFSVSSLISQDTQFKKNSEFGGSNNGPLPTQSRLTMLVDDQKENPDQSQFSVMEQSMEEEEEEKLDSKQKAVNLSNRGLKDISPNGLQPVLQSRHTSRTINGFGSIFQIAEGRQYTNESFFKDPTSREDDPKLQINTSSQAIDKNNSLNRGQTIYNINRNSSSHYQNYSSSANKTHKTRSQPARSLSQYQAAAIAPSQSYGQRAAQQKKGHKFIKTLIQQRANVQGETRNIDQFNQDMSHMGSTKTLSKINDEINREYESISPNPGVGQSYYSHPHQSSLMSGADVTPDISQHERSQQYSAISIKRGSHNNLATSFSGIDPSSQIPASFMGARIKQHMTSNKKRQQNSNKQSKYSRKPNYGNSLFENVYNVVPDNMTKIALSIVNRARAWEDRADVESSRSQKVNQRSYLQNLNELVKIHNEMKHGPRK